MCAKSIAKIILVVFNIIFVILGGLALGLGIFVYIKRDDFGGVLARVPLGDDSAKEAIDNPSLLESGAIALMVGGGLLFFIGFMGCCGAIKEWRLFLGIYIVLVTLIILIQVAAGVLAFFFSDTVEDKLRDFLTETIEMDYTQGVHLEGSTFKLGDDVIDLGWDLAQITFECCGANNYSDWDTDNAQKFNRTYGGTFNGVSWSVTNALVPLSCCKISNPEAYPDKLGDVQFENMPMCLQTADPQYTNRDGCYDAIKEKLDEYTLILQILGIVIAVMEILGVIAAIYLCCVAGDEK